MTSIDVSSCASTPSAPTTPNPMNLSGTDKLHHNNSHDAHNTSGSSSNIHQSSSSNAANSNLNSSNPNSSSHHSHRLSSSSFLTNQTIPLDQLEKGLKDPRMKVQNDSFSTPDNSSYLNNILVRLRGNSKSEITLIMPRFGSASSDSDGLNNKKSIKPGVTAPKSQETTVNKLLTTDSSLENLKSQRILSISESGSRTAVSKNSLKQKAKSEDEIDNLFVEDSDSSSNCINANQLRVSQVKVAPSLSKSSLKEEAVVATSLSNASSDNENTIPLEERIKMLDEMINQSKNKKDNTTTPVGKLSSTSMTNVSSQVLGNKQPTKLSRIFDLDEKRLHSASLITNVNLFGVYSFVLSLRTTIK